MEFETMTFEKAVTELEKVVAKLEKGNLSLEQSLTLYEKGTKLSAVCHQRLETAKLKLEEISSDQPE